MLPDGISDRFEGTASEEDGVALVAFDFFVFAMVVALNSTRATAGMTFEQKAENRKRKGFERSE